MSIQLILASARGMIRGLDRAIPSGAHLSEEQLEQEMNSMREQLEAPLRNLTLTLLLYSYRSASDEELQTYVRFYGTDSGRWMVKVLRTAWLEAISVASQELGRKLVELTPR